MSAPNPNSNTEKSISKTLTFHYSGSHIAFIGKLNNVFLIYPECHPYYEEINSDTMIKIVAWDDDIYDYFIARNLWPKNDVGYLGDRFYDISYIKEGNMDRITKQEWQHNIGPGNAAQFRSFYGRDPKFNQFSKTKVICLERHSYDLKSLTELVQEKV